MRAVRDAGYEVGIHTWDHIRWQDFVARRDADWTRREFVQAVERFREVFGSEPKTFGAAGWQMNAHAFELEHSSTWITPAIPAAPILSCRRCAAGCSLCRNAHYAADPR